MLRRGKDSTTSIQGYLIGVEVESDSPTTPEQVACRIADGLAWMEGIGHIDVESLGEIQVYGEEDELV